ncbi:MAG TPA: DUF4214 domain-containing protein [Pyrinomonadaceae bacterium]|nr:DUF4214 domain-containing protein [Pyrinomonadaceae bacterium]
MRTYLSVIIFAFGLLLACVPRATAQSGPKRIYIAPDDHTDYMWAGDEETHRQAFLQMIDYYLNLADATAANPAPYQSRWNCDGSFWMWTYEHNRSAAEFERLINRIRDGHISVPLNALVSTYGATPAEAVLRGMYYAGAIERRYQVRFPLAVAMENQTLPYGLGSLWAGAGARWSWRGVCACATQVPQSGDREHDIYWWVGPDSSRILMKWNNLFANDSIGGYAEARRPAEAINLADTNATFTSRYPYRVAGIFGKGWDDTVTLTDEFPVVAQQQTNAARQVIVSNEQDFFQDFETTYGANLPSASASYGNEWDVLCASMAEVSAGVKRSVEKLRSAEALATLISLKNPAFMDTRRQARELAWMNLGLYWEHAWTADGPVTRNARAAWQRRIAGEIAAYVNSLQADAAPALGGMIRKSGANTRFYVFNPLGWTRTDFADLPSADTNPVHVIDLSTGQETPSQVVSLEGVRHLRVQAKDVPSVGYKVYELRAGAGAQFAPAATVQGNVLENDFYRLNVAERGAVTSLIDKTRGQREFVRTLNGRALNDLGASGGTLQVENAGPVSVTLRATAPAPLAHVSRITLFRDSRRIELHNRITQNFGDVRTWGFGFNLDAPDVWHEETGALIRARTQAQGGHYSNRAQNSRYDWLTLNHFADINGSGGVGATLSNADTYFMRLGNSTSSALDTATPQISPLVGGQVDGPALGIPNQGGDSNFLQRFALQTHDAYDPTAAMRFALEHQNPFVAGVVTGGTSYPENNFSLVNISDPNVLLWALKPAEEGIGEGIVARLWNVSDAPRNYTLALPALPLRAAQQTTHLETNLSAATLNSGALSASVAARQLQTFRLLPGSAVNPVDDARFFVRQHYLDFLNREPDPTGFDFWVRQIEDCGGDARCVETKRINVSAAFFLSPEFQETGYLVYRLYRSAYGRMPRFAEFLPDTQTIGQGVIDGAPGWEQQLETNTQNFLANFVARPQFIAQYPTAMSPEAFVAALDANTQGALSAAERDTLAASLRAGTLTRAQVLRAVAEDEDLTRREFNRAFVLMQYFGYLRRNPDDPPNTDFSGYQFWLDKLNQHGGNYVSAEMVKAFIISGEYRARFNP